MMIFLGLELLSLGLYALCAAVDRKTARESALKYLILSSTATAFLLFGLALLFGATGSVCCSPTSRDPGLAADPLFWMGAGMFLIGLRLQAEPRAVPHVDARRLRRRAAAGDRVHERRDQSRQRSPSSRASSTPRCRSGVHAKLLLPVWIVAAISMIAGNVGHARAARLSNGCSDIRASRRSATSSSRWPAATPLGLRYAIYYLTAYAFMNLGALRGCGRDLGRRRRGREAQQLSRPGAPAPWLAAAMTFFLAGALRDCRRPPASSERS